MKVRLSMKIVTLLSDVVYAPCPTVAIVFIIPCAQDKKYLKMLPVTLNIKRHCHLQRSWLKIFVFDRGVMPACSQLG